MDTVCSKVGATGKREIHIHIYFRLKCNFIISFSTTRCYTLRSYLVITRQLLVMSRRGGENETINLHLRRTYIYMCISEN
jgi:hypothetical protein